MLAAGELEQRRPTEQRTTLRVPLLAPAVIVSESHSLAGAVCNVSSGGLFVTTEANHILPVGVGVRVRFQLREHLELMLYGVTRWVRMEPEPGGPPGMGIEFYDVDDVMRTLLETHVLQDAARASASYGYATLEEKFRVAVSPQGWLQVYLCGVLGASEANELGRQIVDSLSVVCRRPVRLFLDVSHYCPCPEATLCSLRTMLGKFRNLEELVGVMVGRSSVGLLQMRRLMREAGIADYLVCFESYAEACRFMDQATN